MNLTATREARLRANGRRNLHVLDEALEMHLKGSAGLKSRVERAFQSLVSASGLPRRWRARSRTGPEVDFDWPDRKLAVRGRRAAPPAQAHEA